MSVSYKNVVTKCNYRLKRLLIMMQLPVILKVLAQKAKQPRT